MPTLIALLLIVMAFSCQAGALGYDILSERPHPNRAFTQGLLIHKGEFVESSGLYRQSYVQRYPVADEGKPLVRHQPRKDFAEGLAFTGEHYWLLTWQQGIARRLDPDLKPTGIARYPGEGWGLTFDGQELIMSDGSHRLMFRHPESFAVSRHLGVMFEGQPLDRLNELEFAGGLIWANVWFDHRIYAISPKTGQVVAHLDLSDLSVRESGTPDAVLNGIAWDPTTETLWVTGKRWQKLYQLKLRQWPQLPD